MRVVIVGAGIGGLCLAQGLVRAGIETVVHERDPALDSRRQGYRLHLDGRAAEALHACLPPESYELFLATTGRPSRQVSVVDKQLKPLHTVRFGEPDLTVPARVNTSVDRSVLRSVLLRGLAGEVRFGREFVRYETAPDGSVRAFFADGSTDAGDLLVAADGVNSRIRAQYLPHAVVRDTGERALYGKTPLTDEVRERLPAMLWEGFAAVVGSRHLGMALGLVDFREPRACPSYAMWALSGQARAFPSDEQAHALDGAGLHELATGLVRHWHPDLRFLVQQADPAETFFLPIHTSDPVSPWPATTVTLLGDAIHAMPPSRGSGANIALKDAGRLCEELAACARGDRTLPEAVGRYETAMLDYGFAAVGESLARPPRGGGLLAALASLTSGRRSSRP